MRGKGGQRPAGRTGCGITPAYAGKRASGQKRFPSRLGSPPRMRGKAVCGIHVVQVDGITPAYAGKSLFDLFEVVVEKDHPRVCGEKRWQRHCRTASFGSPPRMRGKVKAEHGYNQATRITPAYAGKSAHVLRGLQTVWDHPRVCGEKLHARSMASLFWGSPPRMRGKD